MDVVLYFPSPLRDEARDQTMEGALLGGCPGQASPSKADLLASPSKVARCTGMAGTGYSAAHLAGTASPTPLATVRLQSHPGH